MTQPKVLSHSNAASRTYACIDLKSFYASVECVERGLDPLTVNLVVADSTRTDGTICLAVTPSLKAHDIPGRARLFEVKERVRALNHARPSSDQINFIIAPPRMRLYMKYSANIYRTYLGFVSSEDILVYSIDEVFIDLTNYLKLYNLNAEQLVAKMIAAVHAKTGITATAGIGPNLYLAKVAMDITAKHMEPNALGARIATLDELSYRQKLWTHQPLTDFWRVGRGYAKKLIAHGIRTMGDVARVSLTDEDLLFRLFGVNAEFLIDHAWGYEPCTLADIKNYHPQKQSLTEGQVLPGPYPADKARLVASEMVDELTLRLVENNVVASQFVLMVCIKKQDATSGRASVQNWTWVRGTVNISHRTASMRTVLAKILPLYDQIVPHGSIVRKLNLVANDVVTETFSTNIDQTSAGLLAGAQPDLFGNFERQLAAERANLAHERTERQVQKAMLKIKQHYGKNAILRASDFEDGATARKRNTEVGGHRE